MLPALKSIVWNYLESRGGGDGLFETPIKNLVIMKSSKQVMPHHMIYRPAFCLVVQGAKQIAVGNVVLDYSAGMALVVSIELPAFGRVTQASPAEPYIGLTLEFEVQSLRDVMDHLDNVPAPSDERIGIFVSDLSDPLIECFVRLIRLLSDPKAVPILYPAIMREICYYLLTGPNAGEVRGIALINGHTQRIADAIYLLRENFSRSIRAEELAAAARMSLSSFHHHFKTITMMTPLQYQKQLRLLEARRLMVNEAANVTHAAYRVGYESASQFSREYARMFGTPPKRDISTIKAPAKHASRAIQPTHSHR